MELYERFEQDPRGMPTARGLLIALAACRKAEATDAGLGYFRRSPHPVTAESCEAVLALLIAGSQWDEALVQHDAAVAQGLVPTARSLALAVAAADAVAPSRSPALMEALQATKAAEDALAGVASDAPADADLD